MSVQIRALVSMKSFACDSKEEEEEEKEVDGGVDLTSGAREEEEG